MDRRPLDLVAMEEAGLYDPAWPTAGERRELLAYLLERGATVDQLVRADREGRLEGVASDLASFPPVDLISLAEAAAASGVSVDRLRRIRLAVGLPADDETRVPAFVVDDVRTLEAGARLLGDDAIFAFTRVLGASVTRIVESGIGLFYEQLEPEVAAAATEFERSAVGERASAVFGLVPAVVTHLMEEHFHAANLRWNRSEHQGQEVETGVGFVDLVGSSQWAEELTLRQQSLALSRFATIAWDSATAIGGRLVKLIGDEAMFVADGAEVVCDVALALVRAVAEEPALPAARGAVGFGLVTARDGDFFGPMVNRVARATGIAPAGAVALGDDVVGRLSGHGPLQELGLQALRGIARPARLYALR